MSIIGLSVYKLNNITPEQAALFLKEIVQEYNSKERLEAYYLVNQNQPDELITVGYVANWDKLMQVSRWAEDNKVWQRMPNIVMDESRSYSFEIVKEFRRYHLTAETTSLTLYRKTNPAISAEEALALAKARSKVPIAWPELVHYRLGRCLNDPDMLLMCNDWYSSRSRAEYMEQYALDYRNWLREVGYEYIYLAANPVDILIPPAEPTPRPFRVTGS